jgi:hypothetical protein
MVLPLGLETTELVKFLLEYRDKWLRDHAVAKQGEKRETVTSANE